jgi:hypothetical protein
MRRLDPEIIEPSLCTDVDIAAFCDLVRQGEEVEDQGLEGKVRRAKALVFLYVDRGLTGVAGLKRPTKSYRDGVFQKAGVPKAAASFELELGWVFVPAAHRGRQYSKVLCASASCPSPKLNPLGKSLVPRSNSVNRRDEPPGLLICAGLAWSPSPRCLHDGGRCERIPEDARAGNPVNKSRRLKPLSPKVARHQPVRNTRLKGSSPVDPAN